MNNFNWDEFKNGNVAVWCKTEEQAKDFIEESFTMNLTWEYNEYVDMKGTRFCIYHEKTCYIYDVNNNCLRYDSIEYFKKMNYKIIEWK